MQLNRFNSYMLIAGAFECLGVAERVTINMHLEVEFPSCFCVAVPNQLKGSSNWSCPFSCILHLL